MALWDSIFCNNRYEWKTSPKTMSHEIGRSANFPQALPFDVDLQINGGMTQVMLARQNTASPRTQRGGGELVTHEIALGYFK
jgi:hypothetical protein